ncbi:MAG: hypothetical protein AAF736_15380 [Pseudomonadota bacterium]
MFLKRLLKFLHTASAVGLAGGLAAYMIILAYGPTPESLPEYTALRQALAVVSKWLLMPSMVGVLVTGLLAMAAHYPYMEAPWVWAKAVSGILVFEATLGSIDAPAQRAAATTAKAMAGEIDAAEVAALMHNEWGAWWMVLALSAANVALAIWRPRFGVSRGKRLSAKG